MSAIIGPGPDGSGKLRCNIHEFETTDFKEWHEHMEKPENAHVITGETLCEDCKRTVLLGDGVPYTRNLKVRCPDCFDNYMNLHNNLKSTVSLKKVENTQ